MNIALIYHVSFGTAKMFCYAYSAFFNVFFRFFLMDCTWKSISSYKKWCKHNLFYKRIVKVKKMETKGDVTKNS